MRRARRRLACSPTRTFRTGTFRTRPFLEDPVADPTAPAVAVEEEDDFLSGVSACAIDAGPDCDACQ